MTTSLQWSDIALRLAVTVAACILIGFNRSEHGKAAGMRTTLLVGLAASVAMIQVNLLLPTAGRPPGSFVMNDLMRFPLGILTGVGFIGGGAILRRESIVIGVTTAATLWLRPQSPKNPIAVAARPTIRLGPDVDEAEVVGA